MHEVWTSTVARLVVILLVVLIATPAAAERLPLKSYTTNDGLAHNTVHRLVRDSHGFLWFCTAGGLSRFDGYSFRTFNAEQGLPHSSVFDFLETRAGEYWVATGAGLVRFDPRGTADPTAKSARRMFTLLGPVGLSGRASAVMALLEAADGTIWVGTRNGLFRVTAAQPHVLEPIDIGLPAGILEREVVDIIEDGHGTLWIGATSGLYRRWQDASSARYMPRDGLSTTTLSDLFEDHRGQLWAATRDAGFFSFSADSSHQPPQMNALIRDGVSTGWVFELYETSDKRLLLGTDRGFHEYFSRGDSAGPNFKSYGPANGVTDNTVTALAEDLAGNLWLGTGSAGAIKVTRGGFTSYGEADWIKSVYAAFEDGAGGVCFRAQILGDRGATVFDAVKMDLLRTRPSDFHLRFGCLYERGFEWFVPTSIENFGWVMEGITLRAKDGEWWFGSAFGLYRFAPVAAFTDLKRSTPTAVYFNEEGNNTQVYRIFEDSKGNIWNSTISERGMAFGVWTRSTGRIQDLSKSPGLEELSSEWTARSFAEDRAGGVWIGFDGQLARYQDGRFALFTASDGVPPGPIREMHLDRAGRLWLASTQSGLARVEVAARPTFTKYTTANGLSSNNLAAITEDLQGYIYTGGGNGLDRLDPETGHVKHFTVADGLPAGVLRSAFRDSKGVLWFGTSNGLVRFAPVAEPPTLPPPVLITALSVAGTSQPVSALGSSNITLADLEAGENEIRIDFVGLGFGSGEVLRYQYRLGGPDAAWSVPTEQRSITYGRLSPGAYLFAVRALTSDGVVSATPAVITFTILSPIWQRWWFLSLLFGILGLAAYAGVRYRVARLLEVANMRTQIATELHDDIGANLTRIALLSEVAVQRQASPSSTSIARIARESVGSMSDIVWAINPKRESLLDLTRRMRQHADELFTLRGIDLTFTAPAGGDGRRLSADLRRDFLLTFKEAVHNAARHSGCSSVEISLVAERRRLTLVVTDNGRGFDPLKESEGQGLTNMRKRAQRLNGDLEIRTGAGLGTTVTISVPL